MRLWVIGVLCAPHPTPDLSLLNRVSTMNLFLNSSLSKIGMR